MSNTVQQNSSTGKILINCSELATIRYNFKGNILMNDTQSFIKIFPVKLLHFMVNMKIM